MVSSVSLEPKPIAHRIPPPLPLNMLIRTEQLSVRHWVAARGSPNPPNPHQITIKNDKIAHLGHMIRCVRVIKVNHITSGAKLSERYDGATAFIAPPYWMFNITHNLCP